MPALDGVRAIAVLMVFAIHAFPGAGFPGGLGVDVFFVLSGFLITLILLNEWERYGQVSLRTFYLKRFIRLYPPLIVVAVLFIPMFFVLREPLVDVLGVTVVALSYTSNVVMTVTDKMLAHMAHTWSLSMEEQFYLFWPLVLVFMLHRGWDRKKIVFVTAALAACSTLVWIFSGEDFPYNPLAKGGALLAGCIAALVVHAKPTESRFWAMSSLAIFVGVFVATTMDAMSDAWAQTIAGVVIPFIVLHLAYGESWLVKSLSVRWLVYLGEISYGIYLWHYPVMYALRQSPSIPDWGQALIAACVTLGLSMLTNVLLEAPLARNRASIISRVVPRSPARV